MLTNREPVDQLNATVPWQRLLYFFGAIFSFQVLLLAIQYGNGYYNFFSFRFLVVSIVVWVLLIPALFLAHRAESRMAGPGNFSTHLVLLPLPIWFILELILGLQDSFIFYNQVPFYPIFVRGVTWVLILLAATYLLEFSRFSRIAPLKGLFEQRFFIIILLNLILKFATVFASFIHQIDVGIMMQEASAHLLAGLNPYAIPTAGHAGFVYLPMHLLLPLPFYVLLGDTRFGGIIWELVGVIFLYALARRELADIKLVRLAELVLLLFLWQPRSLFVIEQAWGEPLAIGMTVLVFYFFARNPDSFIPAVLLAVLLAIKQYLIFMALPLFMLYHFKWKQYGITAVAFGLIILPFVLWDPPAFYNRNVVHFFRLPVQTSALSLTAYLWEHYGLLLPRWISPVLAAVTALAGGVGLKHLGLVGYFHVVVLTFFSLFVPGQQAFANYYYLLSFFMVMGVIFFIIQFMGRSNGQGTA